MLTINSWCGTGIEYCAAPDCQFQYGPACDANIVPPGASTSSVARTHLGSIPYGGSNVAGVQDCIVDGVMALTFDDGPYLYTEALLDLLDKYNAKVTFMISKLLPGANPNDLHRIRNQGLFLYQNILIGM
jgi:peptidoglycan/xylan/chitin deacetylase (PgdA/CDA1 family)